MSSPSPQSAATQLISSTEPTTHAATMPATRHRKLGFMDLPAELRNNIYAEATTEVYFCCKPSRSTHRSASRKTAIALLHVSRSVRTEFMGIYFSNLILCCELTAPARAHDPTIMPEVQRWLDTWGHLAFPGIHCLNLSHRGYYALTITFRDTNEPRVRVSGGGSSALHESIMSEIKKFALAILFADGHLTLTAIRFKALLEVLGRAFFELQNSFGRFVDISHILNIDSLNL